MQNDKTISWQAPEFEYYQKELSWYWTIVVTALILFIAALWQKNLLFALFIVVAMAMVFIWSKQKPKIIRYYLDDKNLVIGETTYKLESFSEYYVDESKLVLKHQGYFRPHLKITIKNNHKNEISNLLKRRLKKLDY